MHMQKHMSEHFFPWEADRSQGLSFPLHSVVLSWHCREPRSLWYKHAANYTHIQSKTTMSALPLSAENSYKKPPTKLKSIHSCKKRFQWWKQKQHHMN